MKISPEDQKAISLILFCVGFLFFLIGTAAHFKSGFESRAEISTTAFVAAAVCAGIGVLLFLFSLTRKRG